MSRLKNFTSSVVSSYVLLAANMLYTFAQVPIALHYLTRAEFGLWALAMQIAGYIMLIDLGMSGSISRVLIDHKDDASGAAYGGLIKTGVLVGVVQGLLMAVVGIGLAFPIGAILKVPIELRQELTVLLIGQAIIVGFSFATRIFQHLLVAHQRFDIVNYGQAAMFVLSLGGVWAGFAVGWGLYSLLVVQACGALFIIVVTGLACHRLGLAPRRGRWGRANWRDFRSLFTYGKDLFLYSVGMQMINVSQTILLTRFMGLDAAAVWSIASRVYAMLTMLIWRVFEFAGPPLAEMLVRGERERMLQRLRDVAALAANVSVFAGMMLALCNSSFVQVWTQGRIGWSAMNDLLLGLWLIAGTIMRGHIPLAGAIKSFGFLAYVFFFEGALFLGLNILLRDVDGITRMLIISLLCTCALSLPAVLVRTRNYFSLRWVDLATWYQETFRLLAIFSVLALALWWGTRTLPPVWRLLANAIIGGTIGTFVLVRFGLGRSVQADIAGKLPNPIRKIFLAVAGRESSPGIAI